MPPAQRCTCLEPPRIPNRKSPGQRSSGSPTFDALKTFLDGSASMKAEFARALQICISSHPPSDPGQRFAVGRCGEWLLAAAVAGAKGACLLPTGDGTRGYDLGCPCGGELWSVKSSYSRGGNFRITNGQGGSGKGMTHPTVFWSPCLPGLILVDPSRHSAVTASQRQKADCVEISKTSIREHASRHPECVIGLDIPINPKTATRDGWSDVARTLQPHASEVPSLTALLTQLGEASP